MSRTMQSHNGRLGRRGNALHIIGLIAMLVSLFSPLMATDLSATAVMSPAQVKLAAMQQPLANDTAGFNRVVLVGDFQGQLGCGNWDVNCGQSQLANSGGLWTGAFAVPVGSWQWQLVGLDAAGTQFDLGFGQMNVNDFESGIYAEFNSASRQTNVSSVALIASIQGPFGTVALAREGDGFVATSVNVANDGPVDFQIFIDFNQGQVNANLAAGSNRISFDAAGNVTNVQPLGNGEVTIQRSDADGFPLAGSCYSLTAQNQNQPQTRGCDGDDGSNDGFTTLLFPAGFQPGTYTLNETTPADGQAPLDSQQVDLGSGRSNLQLQSAPVAPETGDIVVLRQDTDGNAVGGACFAVIDNAGNQLGGACDEDGDVADDGRIGIFGIPAGTYTLRETRTPQNYDPAADTPVTVNPNDVTNAPVASAAQNVPPVDVPEDDPTPTPTEEIVEEQPTPTPTEEVTALGHIVIYRTDEFGSPVGGACYAAIGADGTNLGEACDEDGFVADDGTTGIYDVPVGEQTIRETRTPDGYEQAPDKTMIVVADVQTEITMSAPAISQEGEEDEPPAGDAATLVVTVPADGPQVCLEVTSGAAIGMLDIPYACDNGDNDLDPNPGVIRLGGLTPGEFQIDVYQGPDALVQADLIPVTLVAGVETPVDIAPPAPATTSFAIQTVDEGGNPVVGACYSINGGLETCNDVDSTITINDVTPGDNQVTMTLPPAGYNLADPASQTMTVAEDGSTVFTFVVTAIPVTVDISVQTIDAATMANVGGACYALNGGEQVCDTEFTGTVVFSGVSEGEHQLVMTAAPNGYEPAADTAVSSANPNVQVAVNAIPVTVDISVQTIDGATMANVGGACYALNGGEQVCDTEFTGTVVFWGVSEGEHQLVMTAAPSGYEPAADTTVSSANPNAQVAVNAIPVTVDISVQTVDAISGELVGGACYALDGGEQVCDTEFTGTVVFSGVAEGEHQLVMTAAPDGYEPAADTTVSSANPNVQIPINQQSGGISVSVLSENQESVPGACISVEGSEPICDDANQGTLEVTDLPPGEVSVAVVSAPEGFEVPQDPQTALVSPASITDVTIELNEAPPVVGGMDISVVYGDDAMSPVANACVTATMGDTQVEICDGAVGDENTPGDTNPNAGYIGFDDLAPGTWMVGLSANFQPDRPIGPVVPVDVTVVAGERGTGQLILPELPKTGTLELVTRAGSANVIGACFDVTFTTDPGVAVLTVCDGGAGDMSGTEGVVQINDLTPGTYSVAMSTVPDGYQTPAEQPAEIAAGQITQLTFEVQAIPVPGSLTVTTKDVNGTPLGNTCYAVVLSGVTVGTQCDATDANPNDGVVKFENLTAGVYQVVQTQPPSNQFVPATTQTVTITAGENTDLEIVMNNRPGRLTVVTVDRDEPTLILQNACYALNGASTFGPFCDADDGTVDGRVVFANLPAGDYTLTQTVATAGYDVAADRQVTITNGGSLQITVQNARVQPPAESGTLVVVPLDPNGMPVAGGCYQVFNGNTPVSQRICDNADETPAQITFANLPVGDFTLREMLAPSPDWQIAPDMAVTIRNGETTTVQVPHVYKNGSVVIQAVSTVGLPLQGACFTLTSAGNTELCTDASGQATVTGLAPGTRQLTQTKAPFGFKLDPTPRDVVVNPGQTTTVRVVFQNEPPPNTGTLQVQKFVCPAGADGEGTKFLGGAQGNAELQQTAGCVPGSVSFTWAAEDGSTSSNTTFQTNKDGRAQITSEAGIFILTETSLDLPGNSAARVRINVGQLTTVIVINFVAPPAPEPVTINVEGYTCAPGFSGTTFAEFQSACMADSQLTNQITVRAEGASRFRQVTGDGGVRGKTAFTDLPAGTYTIWAERPFNIPLSYLFCGPDSAAPNLKAVNGSVSTTQAEGATITCRVFQVPSLYDATHGAIQVQKFNCPINERQRGYDYKNECARATEPIPFEIQLLDVKSGTVVGNPVRVSTNGDGIAQFPMLAAGTYKLTEVGGQWCFAQSNSVDSAGNVVVKNNSLSEVWIYNCVGTKNPPNTGSGDAAELLNPGSSDIGPMQMVPNLIWPTVLLASWLVWRDRRSA
ncbi:MAG: SpaA isopeptide-forming pilin-related protein [Thermomicrobiales bacterium]|nr:SpaA isopeptide-forming pilin-related protein [Thermomicrobiales bacterium]